MDGESKVANAIAMVAATLAIAAVTTAARFYCRAVVIKKLGFDDWSSFAALLCTIGCGVAIAVSESQPSRRLSWSHSDLKLRHAEWTRSPHLDH